MTEHHHHITLTLVGGDDVKAKFTCQAPAGSECRLVCTLGCENMTSECRATHPQEDAFTHSPGCNITTWLGECGGYWWECYIGPDVEPHSGPINPVWEGEFFEWEYA